MKTTTCLPSLVLAGLLAFGGAGCHRQSASAAPPKTLEEGVAQMCSTLTTASPAVQSNLYGGVSYGIRYGNFAKATLALQAIASDPSLNDQQKKLVSDVSDLLKQAAAGQTKAR